MSFYNDVSSKIALADTRVREYEESCMKKAFFLTKTVGESLGWPAGEIKNPGYAEQRLPSGAKLLPTGYMDSDGRFTFVIRLTHGHYAFAHEYRVYLDDNAWTLDDVAEEVGPVTFYENDLKTLSSHVASLRRKINDFVTKVTYEKRWA
jgi:hypothetical protein